ncbi:MAG: ABC transporter substrate-binding protein [Chloroflexota bacterium]
MRLEEVPTRVISADGLRILDYLLSIGVTPLAASTGVGDTFAIALLDRTEQVEKIGSSGDLNIERMASLHPDFIVGFEWNYGDGLDELKQIAPCFVLDGESSPEWEANTRLIARCFAREEEADAAIQAVYERVASIGERIEEPVTISVIYPKADGSFFAMQPDYIIAELLAPAGITVTLPNGLDGEGGSLADVSPELLGDMPGEYLFVLPLPDAKNVIENNPLWETLDAVAAGRVLKGDASTWGNFSPIGLQALLDDVERALLS